MTQFPPYVGVAGKLWHYAFRAFCGLVVLFLMVPILVIVPLSFNSEPYFTYPMPGFSLRWFEDVAANPEWLLAIRNSMVVAVSATLVSTSLGTLAALGLTRKDLPGRGLITAILVSPMIVPIIITAVGSYFFYSRLGLANSLTAIILSHAALGTPFVVITVTATMVGFDQSLTRAARMLGATPTYAFFRITVPLVWPGILSGGLFAFATSFDEVVTVLFLGGVEQRTVPRQMWSGVREQLSPSILAVATVLIVISVLMLLTLEMLRRRNERLRGLAA